MNNRHRGSGVRVGMAVPEVRGFIGNVSEQRCFSPGWHSRARLRWDQADGITEVKCCFFQNSSKARETGQYFQFPLFLGICLSLYLFSSHKP